MYLETVLIFVVAQGGGSDGHRSTFNIDDDPYNKELPVIGL